MQSTTVRDYCYKLFSVFRGAMYCLVQLNSSIRVSYLPVVKPAAFKNIFFEFCKRRKILIWASQADTNFR